MTDTDLATTAQGQIDAVTRTVTISDNGSTVRTVAALRQDYATGIDDLWDACTSPERLVRWFAPVNGDLRLGGTYQIEGNAGGTIKTCDAPTGFSVSWEFGGEVSELSVHLEALSSNSSRLVLEHSADVDPGRWQAFGPGAVGIGWDLGLLGLAHHVANSGAAPAQDTAWAQTDQAQTFMSDSSRRWADASIGAGTPEELARASEMRTTAFYLGTEVPEA
ncbi:SRPBCC family protein [Nocardia sp. 348MFTsu5.1]|uniref:SRPBCC family protein n=1 Tax=Nocardia sp. 348MFTsu5.1 TaxID=1172185 RepID=UPI00035FDB4B|nr:SRPBCC family protein [Nocardia sp. 348MFTsu5.1]